MSSPPHPIPSEELSATAGEIKKEGDTTSLHQDHDPDILLELEDLNYFTDKQLFAYLRKAWKGEDNKELKVIGIVDKVTALESSFYVLKDIRNRFFDPIFYPIANFSGRNTIYLGPEKLNNIKKGDLIQTSINLSPKHERAKSQNPLTARSLQYTIEKITELPKEKILKNLEGTDYTLPYLEDWKIDLIATLKSKEIQEEIDKKIENLTIKKEDLEKTLEKTKKKQEQVQEKILKNIELIENQKQIIQTKLSEIEEKSATITSLQEDITSIEHEKGEILAKLNSFIQEKANLLRNLNLIDEDVLKDILPSAEKENFQYDFLELGKDFQSINEAIGYIQAYLYKKGIMYRREVLENFFTLLTTRDLIVLAGDSGSGKTNLVKSFAEAIGGKYFIIPVKPNWTGAEDLLGYYNPIEQNYLSTLFLDAILEASKNPSIPYLICLDEMNLARVEYYFADFLSLLEERSKQPEIHLYSQSESSHLISEATNFLALLDEAKKLLQKNGIHDFIQILQDESLNKKLHDLCGFKDGDSLLKYHTRLRKSFSSYLNNPASLKIPENVFFIGAINIDETTHYLSPKILDRSHIIRFTNPLLQDWEEIKEQVDNFIAEFEEDLDFKTPVFFPIKAFGNRENYPEFNPEHPLVKILIHITKEYLLPLGVEFGLRSIRQSENYFQKYQEFFEIDENIALNHIIRQKILPKLMFDGMKKINQEKNKKDVLEEFKNYLDRVLNSSNLHKQDDAQEELKETLRHAAMNDWVINYWSR